MVSTKLKGKNWYQIVAPKIFKEIVIGETASMDPQLLKNRVVEVSLTDLTGDTSKYYMKLFFKIVELNGTKALTTFIGHDTTRDYIARVVQTRTTRIDTNDVVNLKDSKVRIKSIAISNKRVSNDIETKIRKIIKDMITDEASKLSLNDFIKEITEGKLQQNIKKNASKIYPIRFFEFRKTEVL